MLLVLMIIKLLCVHDKFSNPFESYLGEDAVSILLAVWLKKVNIVVL